MSVAESNLNTARTEIRVAGMDCTACAAKVEQYVGRQDGVRRAAFIPGSDKVRIDYDPRVARLDLITEGLAGLGHPVIREEDGPAAAGDASRPAAWAAGGKSIWWRQHWTMILSGAALLAGIILLHLFSYGRAATALFTLAMIAGGIGPARAGWQSIRLRMGVDMNVLMVVAAIGAAVIGEWAEGATVVFLFAVGEALEGFTVGRARRAIHSLMSLAPDTALVVRGGRERQVPASEVEVGETIVVRPGARVPIDGTVTAGRSFVNQAPITGESMPVHKGPGDAVFAGTVNGEGALEVRVERRAGDTALARIVRLVEEAGARKARIERFINRFARYYTPFVMAAAVLVMVGPPVVLGLSWAEWFYRGLALLLIACPCALVLSTPVSVAAAVASAARNGVLIKGGVFLEAVGKARIVAFDKTGTLTRGRPEVTDIIPFGNRREEEVLAVAASVEARSEHPVARAVRRRARAEKLAFLPGSDFKAFPGLGASARVGAQNIIVGNPRLYTERGGALLEEVQAVITRLEAEGKTPVLVACEGDIWGLVAVADQLRDTAPATVSKLGDLGVRTVMLTGDNEGTARTVAGRLGIEDCRYGLLPEDKLEAVRELEKAGNRVVMVGDGINDAPALAAATVGVAMGAGTDAALETADIALMGDDPAKIPFVIRLSRGTRNIVAQNITIALVIKLAAVALIFQGWLTLWLAVMADTGAAVLVVANGMRLLRTSTASQARGGQGFGSLFWLKIKPYF
ncbi:heavy metal translocating P-type ATPase [Desulforudis sp. 1088]|uniref:heavy metal translocating P-type ATPase n=3 Tax=Candidatus Desulforudis TaxID=471826 RepID=UPI003CE4A717